MTAFLTDLRATLRPRRDDPSGPLAPMLVTLTVVTGLVDAFSYLVLGHVFVANMTGNVILLGLALVGAPGFSVVSSAVALAAFAVGGLAGGRLEAALGERHGRQLTSSASAQVVCFAVAAIVVLVVGVPVRHQDHVVLVAVLALAMGLQNATARHLAVPDLTTTVLTQTITGLTSDSVLGAGSGSRAGRRLVAVGAMLVGAIVGGTLALHGRAALALCAAATLAAGVAVSASRASRPGSAWAAAMG